MKKKTLKKSAVVSTQPKMGQGRQPETGFEVIGREKIYFERCWHGEESVTHYGPQNVSDLESEGDGVAILSCSEKPIVGEWEWTCWCGNERVSMRGPVTNKLQAILNKPEARSLFHIVNTLRNEFPIRARLSCRNGVLSSPHAKLWSQMCDCIYRDIRSGGTHNTDVLATCIEAAALSDQLTKTEKIYNVVEILAHRQGRVPTKREVRDEYEHMFDFVDEGNFSNAITNAGLAWLPTRLVKGS